MYFMCHIKIILGPNILNPSPHIQLKTVLGQSKLIRFQYTRRLIVLQMIIFHTRMIDSRFRSGLLSKSICCPRSKESTHWCKNLEVTGSLFRVNWLSAHDIRLQYFFHKILVLIFFSSDSLIPFWLKVFKVQVHNQR